MNLFVFAAALCLIGAILFTVASLVMLAEMSPEVNRKLKLVILVTGIFWLAAAVNLQIAAYLITHIDHPS